MLDLFKAKLAGSFQYEDLPINSGIVPKQFINISIMGRDQFYINHEDAYLNEMMDFFEIQLHSAEFYFSEKYVFFEPELKLVPTNPYTFVVRVGMMSREEYQCELDSRKKDEKPS